MFDKNLEVPSRSKIVIGIGAVVGWAIGWVLFGLALLGLSVLSAYQAIHLPRYYGDNFMWLGWLLTIIALSVGASCFAYGAIQLYGYFCDDS